ncbi:hypothetical protein BY996DRAFT_6744312 [Phakopsora pachyrhizi]|uniref:Expressed protein n=1 Tax=Phakopsora pachyrhizi TaxID=170000 RepID=A0AAV0ASM7_PHAPC|nr:hypothetical protein BY996DRAFT_6744312 [Phakopsora pachyrhizi]CAH7671499.1 expressed protein [Phakopsora pachyrhizi]
MNLFGKSLWVCLATIYTMKCANGMVPKRSLIEILNGDARSLHPKVDGDAIAEQEKFLQQTSPPLRTKKYFLRGENDLHKDPIFSLGTSEAEKRPYEEVFGMGENQALPREKKIKKSNQELQLFRTPPYFIHPASPRLWRLGLKYDRGEDELSTQPETRDFFGQMLYEHTGEISSAGLEIASPSTSLAFGNNKSNFMPVLDRHAYFNIDGMNQEFQRPPTFLTLGSNQANLTPYNYHHSPLIFESSIPIPSTSLPVVINDGNSIPEHRKTASFNFDDLNSIESSTFRLNSESRETIPMMGETIPGIEHESRSTPSYSELDKERTTGDMHNSSPLEYISKKNSEKKILMSGINRNKEFKFSRGIEKSYKLSNNVTKPINKVFKSMKGKKKKKLINSVSEDDQYKETLKNKGTLLKGKAKVKKNREIVDYRRDNDLQEIFWNRMSNILKSVKSKEIDGKSSNFSALKNKKFIKTVENTLDDFVINLDKLKSKSKQPKISEAYKLNKVLKELLDQSSNQIRGSLLDDMEKLTQESTSETFKTSAKSFFETVKTQTRRNGDETFYITKEQASILLKAEFKDKEPRIYCIESDILRRSYYLSTNIVIAIRNFSKIIPSEELFTADGMITKIKNLDLFMGNNKYSKLCDPYTVILRNKIVLRNLFLIYTTMINKIFREGPMEDSKTIFERQKIAVEFFDSIWNSEHLKFDDKGRTLFLEQEHLPLPEERRLTFLETYQVRRSQNNLYETFPISKINRFNPTRTIACWNLIALWLANCRYDLYKVLFTINKIVTKNFKNLITSIVYCLAKLSLKNKKKE